MTDINEGYQPPTKEKAPEDPKDKKPLLIRIHLLCDGTKNNKTNIAEREKFEQGKESAAYKKQGTGSDNSYDNGKTNIALMEPHVEVGLNKNGYDAVVKVYVEGQGTFDLQADGLVGYAMGAGASGVYQRARDGINKALIFLQKELFLIKKPEKHYIKQVDIDVFGFSRGAATARHAIHAITTEESMTVSSPDGIGAETVVITYPLEQRLRQLGYTETRPDNIKIIFAGLYDTVVSVNASQLKPAWMANNTRDQRAVAKAKFALHLAAADEHREDFPLHTIKSSKSAGKGAEFYLPGAHSDVGGSYNLANMDLLDDKKENARIREVRMVGSPNKLAEEKAELISLGYRAKDIEIEYTEWGSNALGERWPREGKLYVYRQIDGFEYARPSDEVERVINRGRVSDLKEDMRNLKIDGWYKDGQIRIEKDYLASSVRTAEFLINPIGAALSGSPVSGKLITNRRGIKSAYSNIPLKIMAKYARKYSLKIVGKLEQRADITIATDPALQVLEKDLEKYIGSKGNTGSKPEDWLEITSAKRIHNNIQKIRNEHLHMSSRFNTPIKEFGFTPRIIKNRRRRFYYEG
jgi:hypothetical protein